MKVLHLLGRLGPFLLSRGYTDNHPKSRLTHLNTHIYIDPTQKVQKEFFFLLSDTFSMTKVFAKRNLSDVSGAQYTGFRNTKHHWVFPLLRLHKLVKNITTSQKL